MKINRRTFGHAIIEHIPCTRGNLLEFLAGRGPHDVIGIRFGIDVQNGSVYSESQIKRVLKSLSDDDLIMSDPDGKWRARDTDKVRELIANNQ